MPDRKTIGPGAGVPEAGHPRVNGDPVNAGGVSPPPSDSLPQGGGRETNTFVTMPGDTGVPAASQANLPPQRGAFFAAGVGRKDMVNIVNWHADSPIYGYVPEFKKIAEELMETRDYILVNGITRAYEATKERLQRNFRRLEVTFERSDDDCIHAREARLESDTLKVTLAISERHRDKIFEYLRPGGLAFLIIYSFDRGADVRLHVGSLVEPETYEGVGRGLFKRLVEVGDRFSTDKNPVVHELKVALRRGVVPERFVATLMRAGWLEKDAMAIAGLVGKRRFRFNIEPEHTKGTVLIMTRFRDYHSDDVVVRAHPDDVASFTIRDIYAAMARGVILATSFSSSSNREWEFKRDDLARPLLFMSRYVSAVRDAPGRELASRFFRNVYGDWDRGWLLKMDNVLRLLLIFQDIAQKGAEAKDDKFEERYKEDQIAAMVAEKMEEVVRHLVDWGPTKELARFMRLLSKIKNYVIIADSSVGEGITVSRHKDNANMIVVRLSANGYRNVSEAGLLALVSELGIERKGERGGPLLVERVSAILNLFLTYMKDGRGAPSSGISINGNAPRGTLNGLASAISRLWNGGDAPTLEAEAFRSWAEQRKNIFVEQITARAGQEGVIAIPVENGLLVIVEGEAPSEAQWKTLLATAYLSENRPVAVYHGRKGEVADISGYDPKRVRDFMDRVAGRTRSESEGAETNPAWAASTNKVKKERYVRALRWMQENRRRFILDFLPAARDDGAALKRKHDRFSGLYHPDRKPADTALFSEAAQHWVALRDISKGDIAMSVEAGAGTGPGSARFAHYLRMIAEEISRASSVEEVTRRLTDLAKEFALDPRELIDSLFNADNRLHRLWNESAGRTEMDALRGRLKTLKGRASPVDARPAEHVK